MSPPELKNAENAQGRKDGRCVAALDRREPTWILETKHVVSRILGPKCAVPGSCREELFWHYVFWNKEKTGAAVPKASNVRDVEVGVVV